MLTGFRTLVLDRAFQPVLAIDWRRAMVLALSGRVEVLEEYGAVVRSARTVHALPAVVRVPHWVRRHRPILPLTRANILLRDEQRCQYCARALPLRFLTVDHVMPSSRGGATSWDNVVAACGDCNRRKGNRTPDEAGMPLLRRPFTPKGLPQGRRGMWLGQVPEEWRPFL